MRERERERERATENKISEIKCLEMEPWSTCRSTQDWRHDSEQKKAKLNWKTPRFQKGSERSQDHLLLTKMHRALLSSLDEPVHPLIAYFDEVHSMLGWELVKESVIINVHYHLTSNESIRSIKTIAKISVWNYPQISSFEKKLSKISSVSASSCLLSLGT